MSVMSPRPMNNVMCSTTLQMMSNVLLSPLSAKNTEVRLLPPRYDAVIPTPCCEVWLVWPRLQNTATMCSPSSFIPKHAVKLLTSHKHAVKLLTSPKHAVKLLTTPKHAVKLLTSPKHAVKLLLSPSPKYAVKLLPYLKHAVMLLLSSSPKASTLRSCSPSHKYAVKLIPRPPCTLHDFSLRVSSPPPERSASSSPLLRRSPPSSTL